MSPRFALLLAAKFLFAAVVLGAWGAHAFRANVAVDLSAIYATAVQYHFWHALGLLAVGVLLTQKRDSRALAACAWLLVAGIVLFSGSLYLVALTGNRAISVVAPAGGIAFLAAWASLAWAAWRW
jgi:uncharacterized membrane protein YgdD (TMEM256/DUF423 family)